MTKCKCKCHSHWQTSVSLHLSHKRTPALPLSLSLSIVFPPNQRSYHVLTSSLSPAYVLLYSFSCSSFSSVSCLMFVHNGGNLHLQFISSLSIICPFFPPGHLLPLESSLPFLVCPSTVLAAPTPKVSHGWHLSLLNVLYNNISLDQSGLLPRSLSMIRSKKDHPILKWSIILIWSLWSMAVVLNLGSIEPQGSVESLSGVR